MKDKLEGKTITEFVTLTSKPYSYLTDDDNNIKKAKGPKKYLSLMIVKIAYLRMKS